MKLKLTEMLNLKLKHCVFASCIAALLTLAGCDGDSRPFTEAAEVQSLQLTAINPTPPERSLDTIYLNSGQQLQLGLRGVTDSGATLVLGAADRSWYSTNPEVLSVDGNGLVTAISDGTAEAFAVIGGIASTGFPVIVSNATLTSISAIEGSSVLERCISQDYWAIGAFSDTSLRLLQGVEWAVSDESAFFVRDETVGARITAVNDGLLELSATVGEVSSAVTLTVSESLQGVEISPTISSLDIGDTREYTATGTYSMIDEAGVVIAPPPIPATREVIITTSVQWSIGSGTDNASVSNSAENKGLVTGLAEGSADLMASCGSASDTLSISIEDTDGDSDINESLSFNVGGADRADGGTIVLPISSRDVEVRVSTGTTYDSSNDVSSRVIWSHDYEGTLTNPIGDTPVAGNIFFLNPIATGTVNIFAEFEGATALLTVQVVAG